jgi:hypothetical protein
VVLIDQSIDDDDDNDEDDLTIETQHVWNVKTKLIPLIIWASGTISISFCKYPRNTMGKHEIKDVQNIQYRKQHYMYHKFELQNSCNTIYPRNMACFTYRGADKSLARAGRKQATVTEDFEFHVSYL